MKDDRVRSCFDRTYIVSVEQVLYRPKYTVSSCLLHFFLLVPCKTWCVKVNLVRIFVFLDHRIHSRKEYCLSFAQILSSRYQS